MSDLHAQQLVVFTLAGEQYGLPIAAVHEIIRYTEPRSTASASPWTRGVIGLRGKIIPVYDLAIRLGLRPSDAPDGKIVIVETADGHVGVVVDDVEEVLTVEADQLEDVPGTETDTVDAIAKVGDRLIVLLNPRHLFSVAPEAALAA